LLLVNFRPEYRPPWHGRDYHLPMLLAPLAEDAQHALIADPDRYPSVIGRC
jgi:hypothetical protein